MTTSPTAYHSGPKVTWGFMKSEHGEISLNCKSRDFYAIVYFYQNNKLACFTFQQRMTTALLFFKVWWWKTEIFLMDAMCVLSFFWHISLLFLWRSLANVEFFCVLEVDHEHLVKHWNEWNNFRTCLFNSSPFFSTLKSSNGLEELTFHNR